ncbi:MAG TPA: FG-GAP-like repeat-containing protein, partial [Candidatus Acidoferrum sp.]|nr:FG-GAP-like repeat-containing protein [Candidatus Acidoferrum sp.]
MTPGFDDFVAEKYHDQVAEVFRRWIDQLLKSVSASSEIESALDVTLTATPPIPTESQRVRTSSFLNVSRAKFSSEKSFQRAAWIQDWRSSLSHFSALQTAEFQVTEIELNNGVGNANAAPSSLRTRVRFELVGSGNGFHREHRVGNWEMTWRGGANGDFKITRWLIIDETRSQSLVPVFTDIGQQALGRNSSYAAQFLPGIDHWRTVLDGASGIDIYGHNGISFADIDGDGLDDLYICQPAGLPNRLFRNRGDGTFEDITESSGLGLLDNTACAL